MKKSMYEKEYIELRALIAEMTKQCILMIENSKKALLDRNTQLANKVIEDDDIVDDLDIKIDKQCMRMLALFEPKATDLRYILTASKIMMDLERIGDYAVSVSKKIKYINEEPQLKPYIDLPKMADYSIEMLNDAINAFFNRDVKLAIDVIKRDDFIDDLKHQIIRELFTYIAEDISKTKVVISLIQISTALERIADHVTNIAELVFYIVEGKIIRHKSFEEIFNEENLNN